MTEQNPEYYVNLGIEKLVKLAGENSRDHGFHEDWPREGYPIVTATGLPASDVKREWIEQYKTDVRRAIAEKLALIHEEVSEALGEIRSGHEATKVYYRSKVNGLTFDEQDWQEADDAFPGQDMVPVLKPEGFGVELADAVIRIADLAYLTGVDLGAAILEKHDFNKTRPAKHGRKF